MALSAFVFNAIADDIRTGRRGEVEFTVRYLWIDDQMAESDARQVAECILEFHHRHILTLKPHLHRIEIRVLDLGREHYPLQPIGFPQVLYRKAFSTSLDPDNSTAGLAASVPVKGFTVTCCNSTS